MTNLTNQIQDNDLAQDWKNKFQAIFRSSLGSVCLYRLRDGLILDVNDQFLHFSGYSRAEIQTRTIGELGLWAVPEQSQVFHRILMERGLVQDFKCLVRRQNQENLYAYFTAVKVERGGETYVLVEAIAITDRRENEAFFLAQERRRKQAPHGYYRSTPNGIIREANLALARMLGYETPEEIQGRNIASFYVQGQPPQAWRSLLNDETSTAESETRLTGRDGRSFWARELGWAIHDLAGNLLFYECNLVDIDQQKQVEVEANQRREELEIVARVSTAMRSAQCRTDIYSVLAGQLRDLLGAQGVAIILWDNEAGIHRVELGFQAWQAWTGTQLMPDDWITAQIISQAKPYLSNNLEFHLPPQDWERYGRLSCLAGVPLIANKQTIGALLVGRNLPLRPGDMQVLNAIGDMAANAFQREKLREDLQIQLEALNKAQTRLVQSEKLASIGGLVAGVAHELNNPLTTVLLFSQMIQQKNVSDDVQIDLDRIIFAARQATNIVRSLLDFARQRAPDRRPVQINNVLKSSLDFLTHELASNSIHWEIQADPDLPITMGDPHQLHQVFINLIQNACHAIAMARSYGALVATTEVGPPHFLVDGSSVAPVIRIALRDDGVGIAPDVLKRIFDPFFTTKPAGSGTGLGLSVCHGIITEHKGHIWAESEEGHGAVFYIELPIIEGPHIPSEPAPMPAENKNLPGSARVLVVEDQASVLEVIHRALERQGYSVDVKTGGLDGLRAIQQNSYDLVISDMHLPELKGPDLYRQAVEVYPNLARRFIFMSGDTISHPNWRFLEETGVALLTKPFDLDDLYTKVKAILDQDG